MFKDAAVGNLYKHDPPFTYFPSTELHLGEISLECSRPGAAAGALSATQKLMPLELGGEFARSLDRALAAARHMYDLLTASKSLMPLMSPELDIVVYAVNAADTEPASAAARQVFDPAANKGLHLTIITLPMALAKQWIGNIDINSENIACLRSVVMRLGHGDWCERIVALLEESVVQKL